MATVKSRSIEIDDTRVICNVEVESAVHLFTVCPMARILWVVLLGIHDTAWVNVAHSIDNIILSYQLV